MKALVMVSVGVLALAVVLGWSWLRGAEGDSEWSAEGLSASDAGAAAGASVSTETDGSTAAGAGLPAPAGGGLPGPSAGAGDLAPGAGEATADVGAGTAGVGSMALPSLAELRRVIDRPALEGLVERLAAERKQRPDDGVLLADLCEAQRLLGKLSAAVKTGERAIAAAPESSRAHHQYAKALALKSQQDGMLAALSVKPRYEAEMNRALALDPANLEAVRERIAYLCFVPELFGGDPEKALRMSRELQAVDAPWGLIMEVMAHVAAERDGKALTVGREALERFPDDQRLQVTVAGLLEDADLDAEAHALWEQALAGPRSEGWYLARWSQARLQLKRKTDLDQALASFDQLIADRPYGDMIPPLADVHARRGETLEALGRDEEAADAFQLALALESDHDRARDGLERMERSGR